MKKSFFVYSASVITIALILMTTCKKEEPATKPSLSTTPVTNITTATATSGGEIADDGGATITANGVCWGATENPTTNDSKTTDGVNTEQFTSNLAGLTAGTTYHVRAYATNEVGTSYGADVSFLTLGKAPSVLTQTPTNITATGATINGTVNPNDLSTTVTFEYGTTIDYGSTASTTQSPATGNAIVNVSASITGLTPATTYHYRIITINSLGTTYSEDKTFTTLGQSPTATTLEATNITATGATLNGTVNANNSSTVVTFEYGTTTSYGQTVTASPSPITGMTNTDVSAVLTGLTAGTTYHYRVKAVNSVGTTYGNDITFTTTGLPPTATTLEATNITATSATFNGTVNANNSSTEIIFEYGTTTSYGQTVIAAQSPVTGTSNTNVSASTTDLTGGTTYHFRIKAVNSLGTTNGDDLTFTTVLSSINDIDGNTYNVVTIGTQVWMAENLKTTKYNDGTAIPNITDNTAWKALATGAYCDNDNTPANSITYGRLYNWYVVDNNADTKEASNGGKNVCPTDWHVPSDAEWTTLTTYLTNNSYGYEGSGDDIAKSMASKSGWNTYGTPGTVGNDQASNNSSGFTALPGGFRSNGGTYTSIGNYGSWWSSTMTSPTSAYGRLVDYSYSDVDRNYVFREMGFSVRCLRD